MKTHKKSILNKFYIVAAFMMLLFFAIIFRVINIQYVDGDVYRQKAKEQTQKPFIIAGNKGNVYASDGSLLATSITKYTIRMDVMSVDREVFERDVKELSRSLSAFLGKSVNYYEQQLRNARRLNNRYLLIARDVGYNDYVKIKQFPIFKLGNFRGGFIAEPKTVRVHPIGKIAERTIGNSDHDKNIGIEGAFADQLKGEDGLRLKQKIGKGQWKPINNANEQEPIDGYDVVATIDVNIQDITHHALLRQLEYFEADHGCAVVMETATGEIKAISNLGRTSLGTYYEKRNYAVWESHEPGSTFKLASLMAALEDRVIDTATVVDTGKGRLYIHGKKVEDSERGGYGEISAARVFEVSSNVGIVKLIRKHYDDQPKKFIRHLENFGLTDSIGLPILGESKPSIPHPDSREWNKISLEWMSWGYGVAVTPLHTLMLYNAVANNGEMIKPRFIKELRKENRVKQTFSKEIVSPKIASPETIKQMKKMMENVVVKGTADNIYSPYFSMAGKTGTAKKYIDKKTVTPDGDTIPVGYSSKKYVASFAGFFPVDEPKYSCIVVIHEPLKKRGYYGAVVAAPVFREIAEKIYISTPVEKAEVKEEFDLQMIKDTYAERIKSVDVKKMPDVKGMPAMDAVSLLENIGLKVILKGMGKVKKQSIKKGIPITKGATIILNLS